MTLERAVDILNVNVICSPKATEFKEAVEVVKSALRQKKAEIEELTDKHWNECRQIAEYDNESKLFADIGKLYSEIRTEAVKKFAEALKAELGNLSKVHLFGATFALVGDTFVDSFMEKYEGENNDI